MEEVKPKDGEDKRCLRLLKINYKKKYNNQVFVTITGYIFDDFT
jgi:hypothetical protein